MSGIWGPERRLNAARSESGGDAEPRVDGLGNPIVAQDEIVQSELDYLRGQVRALEGAIRLLNEALWDGPQSR